MSLNPPAVEPPSPTDRLSRSLSQMRPVSYDCRHYLGDRPCKWHKQAGLICQCEHYEKLQRRILIIKLDAIGDVLRTTCLLPVIRAAEPDAVITWITKPASVPLLENNPYIQEIVSYGPDALLHLSTRQFDRVINLDAGRTSAALASLARADQKVGYILDRRGFVTATNPAAEAWLQMGIFDDLKKQNERTYQEIMCSILDLPGDELKYVLQLSIQERKNARQHLEQMGVDLNKLLIGIHTGGGERWQLKQWHPMRFKTLAQELGRSLADNAQIILFGGPSEREVNNDISRQLKGIVFDAGCDNSLRHFAALFSHCALVVSGDTLAMHVALATGCRVVTLFGPTSSNEIELFGRGEKVIPDLGCLVCYKQHCDFSPNCMDQISVDDVKRAMLRQLALIDGSVFSGTGNQAAADEPATMAAAG